MGLYLCSLTLKYGPNIIEHSRSSKAIALPFAGQDHYRRIIKDIDAFRSDIELCASKYPELFQVSFLKSGFTFHQFRHSKKLDLTLRRIKVKESKQVLLIRPSFAMPYMTGLTDFVSKALIIV